MSTEQRTRSRGPPRWLAPGAEGLSELGWFFFFRKENAEGDPVAVFNYLMKHWREGEAGFFSEVHSYNTICSRVQLQQKKFQLGITKIYFTRSMVKHWNRCPTGCGTDFVWLPFTGSVFSSKKEYV